jgi:hypothetical protein
MIVLSTTMMILFYRVLVLIIFFLKTILSYTIDYTIYGLAQSYVIPIDDKAIQAIYSKCYSGLNIFTCQSQLSNDDIVNSYDMPSYIAYANNVGSTYCLECCGDPPDFIDTWSLKCPLDAPSLGKTNVYQYEIRLGRNQYLGDTTVITCPIKRSACIYGDDGVVTCDIANDPTFLHGYTVTMIIQQYDYDLNLWRGVSSCNVISDEKTTKLNIGDYFYETIILKHHPIKTFSSTDSFKMFVIIFSCFSCFYLLLYFGRRKRCVYCQMKLVFSPRLCYKCVLVGADIPDPILLAALEEKSLNIQGQIPDNMPCQSFCITCFWNIILLPKHIYQSISDICSGIFCCFKYTFCGCCILYKYIKTQDIKVTPSSSLSLFSKKETIDLEQAVVNEDNIDNDDNDIDDEDVDGNNVIRRDDNYIYNIEPETNDELDDINWISKEQKNEEDIKQQLALKSKKYARKLKREKRKREKQNRKLIELQATEIKRKNPNVLHYDINTIYEAVNVRTI